MTDYQQAKLRMFRATLGVFSNHAAAYKNVAALGKAVNELSRIVDLVDPTAPGQQSEGSTGVSAVKESTRTAISTQANDLAGILHAFADETKNSALLTETDYSERALYRKSDADLLAICKRLHTLGKAHEETLKEEGLEDDELQKLNDSITKLTAEIGTPRLAIAEGVSLSKERTGNFKEAMALFRNRLNKLMVRFKSRDVKFYDAYQSARKIINTAKRYETPTPPPTPEPTAPPVPPTPAPAE